MWYKTKLTKYHKQHLSLRSNFWSPRGLQSRHTKVSHMRLFPVSKITGRRYKFRQVLGSAISLCLSIHKNRTVYCDAFQRFNPQNINKSYVTQPLSSVCIFRVRYIRYIRYTLFIRFLLVDVRRCPSRVSALNAVSYSHYVQFVHIPRMEFGHTWGVFKVCQLL